MFITVHNILSKKDWPILNDCVLTEGVQEVILPLVTLPFEILLQRDALPIVLLI